MRQYCVELVGATRRHARRAARRLAAGHPAAGARGPGAGRARRARLRGARRRAGRRRARCWPTGCCSPPTRWPPAARPPTSCRGLHRPAAGAVPRRRPRPLIGGAGLAVRAHGCPASRRAGAACSPAARDGRRARCVLDERDLLRIGAFVGAAAAARAAARRPHAPARCGSRAHARPGRGCPSASDATVELRAARSARCSARCGWSTPCPDAAGPVPDAPPRFTVHRLSGRGARRAALPAAARRCAACTGSARCTGTRHRSARRWPSSTGSWRGADRLLVAPPGRRRCAGCRRRSARGEGTAGAALAHQGQGTSDVLVRPYRQGDELRRVHWRSTARHDELMVRLEERPWRGGMTRAARPARRRPPRPRRRLQPGVRGEPRGQRVRAPASAAASPSPSSPRTASSSPRAGTAARHATPLLDALAALRPSARTDLAGPELTAGTTWSPCWARSRPASSRRCWPATPTGGHAVLLRHRDLGPCRRSQHRRRERGRPAPGRLARRGRHRGDAPAQAWDRRWPAPRRTARAGRR